MNRILGSITLPIHRVGIKQHLHPGESALSGAENFSSTHTSQHVSPVGRLSSLQRFTFCEILD